MDRIKQGGRVWRVGGGLVLSGLLASAGARGEGFLVDRCASIPPGAIPPPAGTHLNAWERAETAKAQLDYFVVYRHEWYMGGTLLGPYGRWHVEEIAKRLPEVAIPVVIEPETDALVNETRRQGVVRFLMAHGVADAEARVTLGFPIAEGLRGEEALRVYSQISTGGAGGAGLGTGAFGTSRGGFAGSLSGGFRGGF